MVRQSRPESAACAVQSGIFTACRKALARLAHPRSRLAAIIDDRHSQPSPRSSLLHAFLPSCPLLSRSTRVLRVERLPSCAWVFALATYTIQNQGMGLARPCRAECADIDRRQASVAPAPLGLGQMTS